MDVSVITTVYNAAQMIFSIAFDSLVKQDYDGTWEIVICDDGSTEPFISTLSAAFGRHVPQVRYIWQPHQGQRRARSRNNGIRCATGKILIMLDGDIAIPSDFVRRHVRLHTSGAHRLVYGGRKWLFLGDLQPECNVRETVSELLRNKLTATLYSDREFQAKYSGTDYAWLGCFGCNLSIPRQDALFFDEQFEGWGAEDQEFACRLIRRHGVAPLFEPSLIGLHLELGSFAQHRPLRLSTSDEIELYIRNLVYLCSLYPELDMTPACGGLGYLDFDHSSKRWTFSSTPRFDRCYIYYLRTIAEAQYATY